MDDDVASVGGNSEPSSSSSSAARWLGHLMWKLFWKCYVKQLDHLLLSFYWGEWGSNTNFLSEPNKCFNGKLLDHLLIIQLRNAFHANRILNYWSSSIWTLMSTAQFHLFFIDPERNVRATLNLPSPGVHGRRSRTSSWCRWRTSSRRLATCPSAKGSTSHSRSISQKLKSKFGFKTGRS